VGGSNLHLDAAMASGLFSALRALYAMREASLAMDISRLNKKQEESRGCLWRLTNGGDEWSLTNPKMAQSL
jgi:hypothetical protein